ncbi:MAG TPA: class I SAM-dependent methyltransferase [Chloroflexota bacterium]|nr:class I SAM-dependent methyltransferase [Chloroflexota bacterium]HUM67798.1 class I SAM-dependent methyltransferase [Chloroflexota bacterium]
MVQQTPKAHIMLEARLNGVLTGADSQRGYETVYSQVGNIAQSDSFYLWILELLALQPGESYLDISCGQAELPRLAQKKGIQAHGMDLSHNALVTGHTLMQAQNLVTANSQQLPYANKNFDVISNIGSLEHYLDMAQAVREMARVLKPDGRALILVPNTFSLLTNVWIAFRQGRTSIDPYQPIQRYAARYEWQQLLEENGLTVTKTLKYERERPRTRPDLMNYVRRPKQMARLMLTPFIPLNLAWSFVFICHKARHINT